MNIEIVEFYPLEKNEAKGSFAGTIWVRLPDIGLHILGIHVSKKVSNNKTHWFFTIPGKEATHHKTASLIRYPFVCFEDGEKQSELIAAIRKAGVAYFEKKLADTVNPIVWPERQPVEKKEVLQESKSSLGDEKKKTSHQMPVRSIPVDQFRDPPKREPQPHKKIWK